MYMYMYMYAYSRTPYKGHCIVIHTVNVSCIDVNCPPIAAQQPPGFEKLKPGQSRPILKGDMKTIESQLARHQLSEQKAKAKIQQREDPFHADPWDNSLAHHESPSLVDSTMTSNEEFYSLDLAHSYSGSVSTRMTHSMTQMEDSFISTMSHVSSQDTYAGAVSTADRSEVSGAHIYGRSIASDLESIPLHDGVGLQQLSRSPPYPTHQNQHHHHHQHYHRGGPVYHHTHGTTSGAGTCSSRHTVSSGATLAPMDSPPMQRARAGTGSSISSTHSESGAQSSTSTLRKQYMDSQHDTCKYSFTFSGITLALLEADPMHTHSAPAQNSPLLPRASPPDSQSSLNSNSAMTGGSGTLSSIDEGGLDPLKYLNMVSSLLEEGINRKALQVKQEELSQVLPNDHLL